MKDCTIAPSCLGNLFNTILAIALEHVVIIGKRSIGDKGALEIAKAIENAECKVYNHTYSLTLHDAHIPGQVIITALSKYQGDIVLYLLPKYRYDFHNRENVRFTPDPDVSLILQKLMLGDLAST